MAFSEQTEKLTQELIQAEYKNACYVWGEKYHTKEEAFDVFDEEVREMEYEISDLRYRHFDFQKYVFQGENLSCNWFSETEKHIKNAIKELAQVGAVLMKIQNTLEKLKG